MKLKKDEIDLAARLHYGFLPERYANDVINAAVKSRPFKKIGGDYCSIFQPEDNRVIVGICDVVGHSIASALLAARVNTFVMTHSVQVEHPCTLIEGLNTFLCDHFRGDTLYTSFFSLFLNLETLEIDFAGAGHPPVIHYRAATRDCIRLPSETTPLGIEDPLPLRCSVNRIKVSPGDKLLLYTDGLIDMLDPQGNPFSEHGLETLVIQHHRLDAGELGNRVFDEVVKSDRYHIRDDILLMTLSIQPEPGNPHD